MIPVFILLAALILGAMYALFRQREEKCGELYFPIERAKLDSTLVSLFESMVLGGVPLSWRHSVLAVFHGLTHQAVQLVHAGLREAEKPVARLSYKMRMARTKSSTRSVSEYLRTITPDKSTGEELGKNSPSTI